MNELEADEGVVGVAVARFGVRHPDGRLVHVMPGDDVPAWMTAVIAPSNWNDGEPAGDGYDSGEVAASTEPPGDDANVATVLAWVGDDPTRAERAYEAEQVGKARVTLMGALESIIDGGS